MMRMTCNPELAGEASAEDRGCEGTIRGETMSCVADHGTLHMNMTSASPTESSGIITKDSPRSIEKTVTRLTELIAERGMKLFAVIDQSAEARSVGLDLRPTILVVFGNPAAGTAVMDAVPLAALDLPLRILVWADAGETKVSYLAPDALADRYALGPSLARNLAGIEPLTDSLVSP